MSNKRRKNTKRKGDKNANEKKVKNSNNICNNIYNYKFNNDGSCTSCSTNNKYRNRKNR